MTKVGTSNSLILSSEPLLSPFGSTVTTYKEEHCSGLTLQAGCLGNQNAVTQAKPKIQTL